MIDNCLVGQLTTPTTSSLLSRNHRLALGSFVSCFSGSSEDSALALVGTWHLALGSIVRYFSGSCEDIALALVGTPCLSVGGPPLRLVGGEDRS